MVGAAGASVAAVRGRPTLEQPAIPPTNFGCHSPPPDPPDSEVGSTGTTSANLVTTTPSRRGQPREEVDKGARAAGGRCSFARFESVETVELIGGSPHLKGLPKYRYIMSQWLRTTTFDLAIGLVITLNSIAIGLEIGSRPHVPPILDVLDDAFLAIYVLELGLRFFADGLKCFKDYWVCFDMFLVMVGMVTRAHSMTGFHGRGTEGSGQVGVILTMRTLRLLRLGRLVRVLLHFQQLWMLVQGLLNSGSTMIYTLLLLCTLLYLFSCIAMELIANNPLAIGDASHPKFKEVVDEYFRSLPVTMVTLMSFITLDNIVEVYKPLVELQWTLVFYFIAVILVVGIVCMNLVTAVIVNSALEQASQDKSMLKHAEEKKRKRLIRDLRQIFKRLDVDGDGMLSRAELQQVTDGERLKLRDLLSVADTMEIFDTLDVDRSGTINIDEFCDGIWQVSISKTPLAIKGLEMQVSRMEKNICELRRELLEINHLLISSCVTPLQHRSPDVLRPRTLLHDESISVSNYQRTRLGSMALSAELDEMASVLFNEASLICQRLHTVLGLGVRSGDSLLGMETVAASTPEKMIPKSLSFSKCRPADTAEQKGIREAVPASPRTNLSNPLAGLQTPCIQRDVHGKDGTFTTYHSMERSPAERAPSEISRGVKPLLT